MQVITIGFPYSTTKSHNVSQINFFSNNTILDADLIIWDVNNSTNFPGNPNTVSEVTRKQYEEFKSGIDKRKKEFEEFFQIGRPLIIINPIFVNHSYTLSGESSDKHYYLNFLDSIDLPEPEIELANGQNITCISEKFASDYLHHKKDTFFYEYTFPNSKGIPLFYIKGTKYVVSQYYEISNGHIVFIPLFNVNLQDPNNRELFLNSTFMFLDEIRKFKKKRKLVVPEWTSNYSIAGESTERSKLEVLRSRKVKLEKQIANQQDIFNKFIQLKALFSSSGKDLEDIVELAMKDFDFDTERQNNNRHDILIKIKTKIAVVEVKGVVKSAAEKHLAQLQKWISSYHIEHDYNPKGILVINTYMNTELEKRSEQDFPVQMLTYAKQMKHCLVTGIQLLCMLLDYNSKKISQSKVIKLLFETVGPLEYTKSLNNFVERLDHEA